MENIVPEARKALTSKDFEVDCGRRLHGPSNLSVKAIQSFQKIVKLYTRGVGKLSEHAMFSS